MTDLTGTTLLNEERGVPGGWTMSSIGDEVEFTHKPREVEPNCYEQVPFISMGLLPDSRLYAEDYELRTPAEIRSGVFFREGDLLLAKITPCLENGKQGIAKGIPNGWGYATTEVFPLRPSSISAEFLAFYLKEPHLRHELASKMQGATGRQRLPKEVLASLPIPIPPPAEREAITHVLRTVQQAKEATEKVIAAAWQLKQSLMRHLFTYGPVPFDQADQVELNEIETGTVPADWTESNIGNVAELKYGYRTSIPKTPPPNGVEIISTADITNAGQLDISRIRTVQMPEHLVDRYTVRRGDLLFNWRNAQEHVGKTALVDFDPVRPIIFASFIIRIRTSDEVDGRFLHYLLTYLRQESVFFKQSRRAVNQANFNANELGALRIALPSPTQQEDISQKLIAVDLRIDAEQRRRNALDSLLKSLLHQLMTGKIRVNAAEVAEGAGVS